MSQADVTAITELTDEIRGFRKDLSVFRTQLFGQEDGENPQGRIPRIEATQSDHERRLVRIERLVLIATGVVLILAFVGRAVEFISHIIGIVGH